MFTRKKKVSKPSFAQTQRNLLGLDSDSDDDLETDNPIKLSVKPHDLEEFSCIVRRHGLWREDIEDFVNAALKKTKE